MKRKITILAILLSMLFLGCQIKTPEEIQYIRENYIFVGQYIDQCGIGGCLLGEVYYHEGKFEDVPIKRVDYKTYSIPNRKQLIENYKEVE